MQQQKEIKEIEITEGNFQTYYLKSKKYVVQYMNGKSDSIKIDFSESLVQKIIHSYYEFNLDDVKKDDNIIMPSMETLCIIHFLRNKSKNTYKTII